jgi:FKBP-type peptidyl-prolyl cis-trans isomerase FkpA
MLTRSMALLALVAGMAAIAAAQERTPPTDPKPAPPATARAAPAAAEEAVYALGLSLWRGLAPLDLSPAEVEILMRGLEDASKGVPDVKPESVGPQLAALRKARAPRVLEKEKARAAEYLAKAEQEPGAVKTASGLVFFEVKPGTGPSPSAAATVRVSYRGTLGDGSEFDRSSGAPAAVRLSEVIPCWREGLLRMKAGGKARLVCPPSLAYGDRGLPNIPGGAALVYNLELVETVEPSAPKAPGSSSR